ncbi:MAG: LamG-like jellyroll fold domain-containing protein [Verrucomicrobiaceae bacterium]
MKHTFATYLLPAVITVLPVQGKLAAWYPLDETQSSTTVTENVSGTPTTLAGFDVDPSITAILKGHLSASQALGTSYLLNDADNNAGAFNLGTSAAVQPVDQFTFTCFIQPSSFNAYDRIFESLDGNLNTLRGIRIDLGASGNQVRFLVRDGSGATAQTSHPLVLQNDGSWYFCAFRYDSASADSTPLRVTVLKLDGSVIDEAAIGAATVGPATVGTGALTAPHSQASVIGSSSPDGGPFALDGAIDELAIYDNSDGNGVLSNEQLATNAQVGPSGVELITAFASDTLSVSPGNPVTFNWTITEPFDSLVLEDESGNSTDLVPLTAGGSGSTTASPSETTTYYLKGVNGDVENTHAIKILSGAAPEITNFGASSAVVQTGSNVDLSWVVVGADTVTLDPGATDVTALTTTTIAINETTTFTLSATNSFGTTTADVTVSSFSGVVPAHLYNAGTETNTDGTWFDQVDVKNLNASGLIRLAPLTTESPNTNITGAYLAESAGVGASVGAYQFAQSTFEIWLRPGAVTADHGVIFETGGGQNGLAALLNQNGLRFIGSAGNVRNLDLVVPLAGLNMEDFIQVVFSHDTATDSFAVSVRDTFGAVRTATETAAVIMGGNGAVVFAWGAGAVGGSENNLGGNTELPGATPEGLTSFLGEIAIINVYDQILDATQIKAAFDSVATITAPPAGGLNAVTAIAFDGASTVTLTWNSQNGTTYDAEFSTSLEDGSWFPLEQVVTATANVTTHGFTIPPNQEKFFLRIIEATPEP